MRIGPFTPLEIEAVLHVYYDPAPKRHADHMTALIRQGLIYISSQGPKADIPHNHDEYLLTDLGSAVVKHWGKALDVTISVAVAE